MSWPSTDFEVEIQRELEWLRYFYSEVDNALGPASDDVYEIIKQNYINEVGEEEMSEDY